MATVQIKIAGADQTANIVFGTARFESMVNGRVGSCKFRVRDELRALSFVAGSAIEFLVDGGPVWTGYLVKATRAYAFPAENIVEAGLTRWIDIEGVDLNILFSRRIVATYSDPADVFGKLYPPFTLDQDVIADLVADYLDLTGDSLDVSSEVEAVADINEDQDARAWSGGYTWGEAMGSIAMLPAAVFFLAPTRKLVYTDANTADAPRAMSDRPVGEQVGYREMVITKDGTSLANDVLAWGFGYGSNEPVFVRDQDATSLAAHGRWQLGVQKPGVWKQATIERVASSIIDGSPSSQRGAKNDRVAVELVTYESGFLPAQKVDFESEVWGFSDVIPIRRMIVTFDGPEAPRYALTLSHEIDTPWGFIDPFKFRFPTWRPPQIDIGDPPVGPQQIIDDFENRTVAGLWGTPSRGLPDWDTVTDTVSGTPTPVNSILVGGGWGRNQQSHAKVTVPVNNQSRTDLRLLVPEIANIDEFFFEFDLVATALGSGVLGAATSQHTVEALLLSAAADGGSITSAIAVTLTLFGSTTLVPHISWEVRDWIGGSGSISSGTIAATGAVSEHVTIDRSVSRGDTRITVGTLIDETVANAAGASRASHYLYLVNQTIRSTGAEAASTLTSDFSVDNIAVQDGGESGVSLLGDGFGFACMVLTRVSTTEYSTGLAYVPGSTILSRGGQLQRRGTDYTEDPAAGRVTFGDSVDLIEFVFACFQVQAVG